MYRLTEALLPIIALSSGVSLAQSRAASESELEMLREQLTLDEIREDSHYRVLEVGGTITSETDFSPERFQRFVYFRPYEIQFGLCMMEAHFLTGVRRDADFDWSAERPAYWNWSVERDSCDISSRSAIPIHAVQSSEPIPSATMAFVIANSADILALAYEFAESSGDQSESGYARILAYRDENDYRLDRLQITLSTSAEFGFAFRASYRADGRSRGPVVVFSVMGSAIVIHDVGHWIA